jgi:hypothetical protein
VSPSAQLSSQIVGERSTVSLTKTSARSRKSPFLTSVSRLHHWYWCCHRRRRSCHVDIGIPVPSSSAWWWLEAVRNLGVLSDSPVIATGDFGLKHGCLRLTPEGDSGAACDCG